MEVKMKINFDAPEEWGPKLDELAQKDGHSNRAAVIRKIITLFFEEKQNFSEHSEKSQEHDKK